jgi:integral membrane sensor domain MASE1
MFIGMPIWFWITVWDLIGADIACRSGPYTLNYINFILLEFYVAFPTLFTSLSITIAICCLPCIIKLIKQHREQQRNQAVQQEDMLTGLSKYVYDPDKFKTYNECCICMCEFDGES